MWIIWRTILGLGLLLAGQMAVAERLTVFAAASLKAPLDAIVTEFSAETGVDVAVSYAASSTLVRQIQFGAPADVFLSADQSWMQHLVGLDLLKPEAIHTIAGNHLILAGREKLEFQPTLNGKIAVPLLDAVPLGRYANAAMTTKGWLPEILPTLVQTDNALTTKTLLLRGEVAFAFLYASDAHDGSVKVVHQFDVTDHPPIIYQAGLLRNGQEFVDWLLGPKGQTILQDNGFDNAF